MQKQQTDRHFKRFKRVVCLIVTLMLIIGTIPSTTMAAVTDLVANGSTATVYTSAGLAQALTNVKYDKIIFANNIQITDANKEIKVANKRNSNSLVIDGNNHTLIEYAVAGCSTSVGIQLITSGTLTNVTIQNLNIIGGNGSGTFRITPINVTQTFKNVVYSGPQLAKNTCGTVRLEDCQVVLQRPGILDKGNSNYSGYAVDAKNVELAGTVYVEKQIEPKGADEPVFKIDACGSFTVAPDAIVDVNNVNGTGGFLQGGNNLKIGKRAVVNVNTMYSLFNCITKSVTIEEGAQFICDVKPKPSTGAVACEHMLNANDVLVDKNATMSITTTGKKERNILYMCGNLTVNDGATLDLIAKSNTYGLDCVYNNALAMVGSGKTFKLNNPKRVLAYNEDTSGKNYASAIYMCLYTIVDITTSNTEYWKTAQSTGGPTVLDSTPAAYKFWQDDEVDGNYRVYGTMKAASCKLDTFTITNYVGAQKYSTRSPRKSDILDKSTYNFASLCTDYQVCLFGKNGRDIPPVKVQYNLTYDINNPYHSDYTGAISTPVTTLYEENQSVSIEDGSTIFSYTDHTFVEWNTAVDGSGTSYAAGAAITMTGDTTLYAIWKSCNPTIDDVYTDAPLVSGTGVKGTGAVGAAITVTLPDGVVIPGTVDSLGNWQVVIPVPSRPLPIGEVVTVVQLEQGKVVPSDIISTTVLE